MNSIASIATAYAKSSKPNSFKLAYMKNLKLNTY